MKKDPILGGYQQPQCQKTAQNQAYPEFTLK
jgi:hypothetical protein